MKEINLTEALKAEFRDDYLRDPKRISASQVYAILQGWEDRPPDVLGMVRMLEGRAKHELVQRLLPDYQHEVKTEIPFGDSFVLVGKVDCLNEDHIIEIKTSRDVMDKAKEWHAFQARLYCSMFEREKCLIYQPVFTPQKIWLKLLRTCKRDDSWFKSQLELLENKLKQKND